MSQPGRRDSYDDVQDEPEELVESESETDDENYEPPQNDKPHNQSFSEGYLGSLDDDALFDMLKKSVSFLFPPGFVNVFSSLNFFLSFFVLVSKFVSLFF